MTTVTVFTAERMAEIESQAVVGASIVEGHIIFERNDGTTFDGGAIDVVLGEDVVTKEDVGLGNVDNTSDLDKPISSAQQAAMDAYPELAAGDPTELQLVTAGGVTTATILSPIARQSALFTTNFNVAILNAIVNMEYAKVVGQYYMTNNGSLAPASVAHTLNSLKWFPKMMSAGTLDRMAIRVSTAEAGATLRLGIYSDSGGLPGTLIAECDDDIGTYPLDLGTAAVMEAHIDAVLPAHGKYWFASVVQTTSSTLRLHSYADGSYSISMPLGTVVPGFSTVHAVRHQTGVSGALPANGSGMSAGGGDNSVPTAIAFRYSA